jgi:hypothetical protein
MRRTLQRWTVAVPLLLLGASASASADSWNERTTLTFSSPVMAPGVTLQPGSYEFRLMNSSSNRHIVQIRRADDAGLVTTALAVPIRRRDTTGDVVLKFDPTGPDSPPAIRAWFYPGSLYGHQFSYPEEQAREIAKRTKTIVLSIDQPGSDVESGVLRTYGPSGESAEWHGDAETLREWDQWRTARRHGDDAASREERRAATAAAMQSSFEGMRVSVDQLEDAPTRYLGKKVSVDAEVEDVLGPRLFTLDESNWGDLEGEILVVMPGAEAVAVREGDRVTISGTVTAFARSGVGEQWGWQKMDAAAEGRVARRPVLVATRVVGGDSERVLVIQKSAGRDSGSETAMAARTAPVVTDIGRVGAGDEALIGHRVSFTAATAAAHGATRGLIVEQQGARVFVLPSSTAASEKPATEGAIRIEGVILQMPDGLSDRLGAPDDLNDEIYVFATSIGDGREVS